MKADKKVEQMEFWWADTKELWKVEKKDGEKGFELVGL